MTREGPGYTTLSAQQLFVEIAKSTDMTNDRIATITLPLRAKQIVYKDVKISTIGQ